jgi:hypothetical protein
MHNARQRGKNVDHQRDSARSGQRVADGAAQSLGIETRHQSFMASTNDGEMVSAVPLWRTAVPAA